MSRYKSRKPLQMIHSYFYLNAELEKQFHYFEDNQKEDKHHLVSLSTVHFWDIWVYLVIKMHVLMQFSCLMRVTIYHRSDFLLIYLMMLTKTQLETRRCGIEVYLMAHLKRWISWSLYVHSNWQDLRTISSLRTHLWYLKYILRI